MINPYPRVCYPLSSHLTLEAMEESLESSIEGPVTFFVRGGGTESLSTLASTPTTATLDLLLDVDPARNELTMAGGAKVRAAYGAPRPRGSRWWVVVTGLEGVATFQDVLRSNFLNQLCELSPYATLRLPPGGSPPVPLRDVGVVVMSAEHSKGDTRARWEALARGDPLGGGGEEGAGEGGQRKLNLEALFNRFQTELPPLPRGGGWKEAWDSRPCQDALSSSGGGVPRGGREGGGGWGGELNGYLALVLLVIVVGVVLRGMGGGVGGATAAGKRGPTVIPARTIPGLIVGGGKKGSPSGAGGSSSSSSSSFFTTTSGGPVAIKGRSKSRDRKGQ